VRHLPSVPKVLLQMTDQSAALGQIVLVAVKAVVKVAPTIVAKRVLKPGQKVVANPVPMANVIHLVTKIAIKIAVKVVERVVKVVAAVVRAILRRALIAVQKASPWHQRAQT
jgi:hypothetical protein